MKRHRKRRMNRLQKWQHQTNDILNQMESFIDLAVTARLQSLQALQKVADEKEFEKGGLIEDELAKITHKTKDKHLGDYLVSYSINSSALKLPDKKVIE